VAAEPLDALVAIYHRPSGTTHLLVEPAPAILDVLAGRWLDLPELRRALSDRYEVSGSIAALAERLDELVAAGLVERA